METNTLKINKTWTNKNGDVRNVEYNQKKYNDNYYLKNKDKLNQKCDCDCGCKYSLSNKSSHLKTKFHKLYQSMKSLQQPIITN